MKLKSGAEKLTNEKEKAIVGKKTFFLKNKTKTRNPNQKLSTFPS